MDQAEDNRGQWVLRRVGSNGVDTTVTDPAGRTAVALELSTIAEGGGPSMLYFDPTTHQLMAEGGPPGTFSSSGFTGTTRGRYPDRRSSVR